MPIRSPVRPARGTGGRRAGQFIAVTALAVAAAAASVTAAVAAGSGAAGAGSASVPARASGPGTSAVVVLERSRPIVGKILVTLGGRALYTLPHGSCGGQCLAVWPPLLMPHGITTPRGASCLATAHFGSAGQRQVTYHRLRLYTFISDHGRGVTGNGVDGFAVAKVVRCARPVPPPSPAPTSATPAPAPSCYPLTNAGNCYQPGEFCRAADHGRHGVAGDGERIVCENRNGWRWEPA